MVLYFVSTLCLNSDFVLIFALGIILRLIGMLYFVIWIFILLGGAPSSPESNQRSCPRCGSRHYVASVRGSRFGFVFPARWVKITRTDFHCQDCDKDWSLNEAEEQDADT